ncbi:MAG: hypothetical protein N2V72_00350 [Methanophagales archaeon]|nr:hypothetical protein [Methanophagales archaeon]
MNKEKTMEEKKMREAFEQWYHSREFVPHGVMIKNLCFLGFKAGVEYAREHIKNEISTSGKRRNKIEIELEKLKIIADYYDLPLAVFFMSVDELKELKAKEGSRMRAIRKELEKLEAFKSVWGEEKENEGRRNYKN